MSNIDRVVNAAIELNANRRNEHLAQMLSARQYAEEYGTIQINAGRMTGKTHYIVDQAGDNDLIIVANHHAREWYQMNGHQHVYLFDDFVSKFITLRLKAYKYDRIWVDEPRLSLNGPRDLENMYRATAENPNQTYIFLGA